MPSVRLSGSDVRVRRARRQDLPRLAPLLGDAAGRAEGGHDRAARHFFRRLLADLGHDVYVAENDAGELVGVVAVAYWRSLAAGRTAAVLDTLRVRPGVADGVLDGLLAMAADRARRRGCAALRAVGSADDAALRARGWTDVPALALGVGAPG